MTDAAASARPVAASFADLLALTKPRLNALTVFAVAAGWCAVGGPLADARHAVVLAASAMTAAGASALNQWFERHLDARMRRTADRPLPAGRISPRDALLLGVVLSVAGVAVLALAANPLTAALGSACVSTYVLLYTPLKTRTTLNTLVGTLPGALPPVMGAAAASGRISAEAVFLFALLAAWQLPHFLSIAWLHREDYRRAGFAMLPAVQGGEASTARQAFLQALLLLVVSLAAPMLGLTGRTYFYAALGLGLGFVAAAALFARKPDDVSARRLLRASLVHLPLVLAVFAWDRA